MPNTATLVTKFSIQVQVQDITLHYYFCEKLEWDPAK